MAIQVKRRRGNTAGHSTFVGAQAELTVNTDTNRVHVHDGTIAAGHPSALLTDIITNCVDIGMANTIVVSSNAGPVTPVDGMLLTIKVAVLNGAGGCSVNYNASGAKLLLDNNGAALAAGALLAGTQILIQYVALSAAYFLVAGNNTALNLASAALPAAQKGAANGVAPLNSAAVVAITQGGTGRSISASFNTFAMMGDSRIAQLLDATGSPTSWGFFNQANGAYGQRFLSVYNAGVGGYRTDQYFAVGLAGAIAAAPKFAVIWGCKNDIDYGATISQIWNGGPTYNNSPGVLGACMQLIAAGITPVLISETGANGYTASQCLVLSQYNQYCRELAETGGIIFIDFTQVIWNGVTSTQSNLVFKTNYTQEGVHPNQLGGYNCGLVFGSVMAPLVPPLMTESVSYYEDPSMQLLLNNLFTTLTGGSSSGGTVSGNIPNYCSLTQPAGWSTTFSSTANSQGYGNDLTLAITASGAGQADFFINSFTTDIQNGIYQAGFETSVAAGSSNFVGTQLEMDILASPNAIGYDFSNGTSAQFGPTAAYTYVGKTFKKVLTATSGFYTPRIVLEPTFTAAGSATITFRRTWLRKRFS